MNRQEIFIKKERKLLVTTSGSENNFETVLQFNSELMRLGFILTQEAMDTIKTLSVDTIIELYNEVVPIFRDLKGDGNHWIPMYPNFPKQVMDASYCELYWNAMLHYFSFGEWLPSYDKEERLPSFENVKFIKIGIGSKKEFNNIFTKILSSNVSISQEDKDIVSWFVDNYEFLNVPSIPFKENLCLFVSENIKKGRLDYVEDSLKTSTDILRVITHISGGDISLSKNTKFKSLNRKLRKLFVNKLEFVISEDDIKRHQNKWNKLFHNLHVGEYKKTCPNVFKIAEKIRNNVSLVGYYSQVEKAIKTNDPQEIYEVLNKRPGEFARKLDYVLRTSRKDCALLFVDLFEKVADKVDTRVLLQLLGHFKGRNVQTNRVVFPKGNVQKAQLIDNVPYLDEDIRIKAYDTIRRTLSKVYSSKGELGNVYIDESLKNCPIPMNMRSASEGLHTVGRGTRFQISDKNTLRLFIWWKYRCDIDLSAVFFDENLSKISHISYTKLKEPEVGACHSGDITNGSDGAAEFIDINIDTALKRGVRYVVMNVLSFSDIPFENLDECFAGWMTRENPNTNEIFDPKTVEQKVDLCSKTKYTIPVIFDLKTKEAIWLDLSADPNYHQGGINVESNSATIYDIIKSSISLENKPTLYELFDIHSKSRGAELVDKKEDADLVFSMDDGITPFNILDINGYI
jgi:hypothetical protein